MPKRFDDVEPKFLDPLRVRSLDGPWYKLIDRMRYYSAELETTVCVPNGFVTDFNSSVLFGRYAQRPAVVHDYLYRFTSHPRIDADYTYLEALRYEGYKFYSRGPMFLGVRAGGWMAFGENEGVLDPR